MRLAILLLGLSVAAAEPLPDRLRLDHGEGRQRNQLFVLKGEESARLKLPRAGIEDVKRVRYDGKKATLEYDDGCGWPRSASWSIAALEARLANSLGLSALEQKQLAEATTLFQRATELDAAFDLARTNLASAFMRAGDRKNALAALRPLMKSQPIALYAKVLTDSDLVALLDTPDLQSLRAQTPGTAQVSLAADLKAEAEGRASSLFAVAGDLVAVTRSESGWGSDCDDALYLSVLRIEDGTIAAEIPLTATSGSEDHCEVMGESKATALANRFLRDVGFQPVPIEVGVLRSDEDSRTRKVYFPQAKLGVVTNDATRVLSGNHVLLEAPNLTGRMHSAVYAPSLRAFVVGWSYAAHEGCEGIDPTGLTLLRLR